MAQTRRKRRRKHKGTQGGRIDRRPSRGRPRSRAEAQARARQRSGKGKGKQKGQQRTLQEPTWGSAFRKGLIAAAIFFGLLALVFGRPPLPSAGIAALMLVFYVPMAYLTDRFFFTRGVRKEAEARLEREQQRSGS